MQKSAALMIVSSLALSCGNGGTGKATGGSLGGLAGASGGGPTGGGPGGGVASGGTAGTGGIAGTGGGTSGTGGTGGSAIPGSGGVGGMSATPIFVAQGHMGRLTISCDDGRTWIANHSSDDSARCFQNLDCDHGSGAGSGLAHGNGWFVATFGWGVPGRVQRSRDGVTWESASQQTEFADIAFGNGLFIGSSHTPQLSSDGATWTPGGDTGIGISTMRAIEFIATGGGRFVIAAEDDPKREIVVSADNGKTWRHPITSPPECVQSITGLAFGAGITVAVGTPGIVCRSPDGGDHWTLVRVTNGSDLTSPPVWDGQRFLVWADSTVYRSPDGQTWTATAGTPTTAHIGPVARSPGGTFVAARWDGAFYQDQEFYRSTDGVNWQVLARDKFAASHPIRFMDFGYAAPSALCPAP
jgi:Photosynthesis system II assembly factor YCF48